MLEITTINFNFSLCTVDVTIGHIIWIMCAIANFGLMLYTIIIIQHVHLIIGYYLTIWTHTHTLHITVYNMCEYGSRVHRYYEGKVWI